MQGCVRRCFSTESEIDHASHGGTHYGEIQMYGKHHENLFHGNRQKREEEWNARSAGHKKDYNLT